MSDKLDVKKLLEEELEKKARLAEDGSASLINKKDDDEDSDSDQNFIKLEDRLAEVVSETGSEVQSLIAKLKNIIFPKRKQQRDLDKETGGLETEKMEEISKKDVWDDRSEEVDKMGSTNTFNTTGVKSVIWKQKFDRLTKKKLEKEHIKNAAEAAAATSNNPQKSGNSSLGTQGQSSFDNMSFTQRLENLRQDRSNYGNKNGGAGR